MLRKDLKKELFNEKLKDLKSLPKLAEKTLMTDNKIQTISNTFNEASMIKVIFVNINAPPPTAIIFVDRNDSEGWSFSCKMV